MELDGDRDWKPAEPVAASAEGSRSTSPGIGIDGRSRAVIAGTTVEAHRIAALLDGGMDVDEVVRDYITLTPAQVAAARILPIDARVARVWAAMLARSHKHVDDIGLAATASVHGLALVTRDVAHPRAEA